MTDPTQFSICSPATGDSPSRSRPSEWPTPQAHDAQGPKTPEQIAAMRAQGHGVRNLNEEVLSAPSDSARSTPTPAPSSPTAGLLSPTSEPFSTSPEIQSLSDAVSSRLSSLVASLASRTQWPESGKPPTTTATSGRIAGESLGIYDPASRCSRTSQACLPLNQELFSTAYLATWPRFGTLASGTLYQQPTLARPTDASASGSSVSMRTPTDGDWPTPTSRDHKDGTAQSCANVPDNALLGRVIHRYPGPPHPVTGPPDPVSGSTGGSRQGSWPTARTRGLIGGSASKQMMQNAVEAGMSLEEAESMAGLSLKAPSWATPTGDDANNATRASGAFQSLTRQAGKLNPAWVEMLQGLPMGWTQLPTKFTKPRKGTP